MARKPCVALGLPKVIVVSWLATVGPSAGSVDRGGKMATREPSTGAMEWYIDGSGPIRLPGDMVHVVRWKAFEPFSEPDDDALGDLPFAARKFLRELGSTDFAVG